MVINEANALKMVKNWEFAMKIGHIECQHWELWYKMLWRMANIYANTIENGTPNWFIVKSANIKW
jgi:hypothetical protein